MKKIMIVEDEVIIGLRLQQLITGMGYEVAGIFHSGEQGLEKARELRPDLIVVDVKLPGDIDGIRLAEAVKTELDVPVVFLTAYTENQIIEKVKITEPYGYIVKPFQAQELKAAIEIALYKKEMERRLRSSEEKYKNFVGNAPIAMCALNTKCELTYANKKFLEITGYNTEDLLQKPLHPMVHPDDLDNLKGRFEDRLSGKEVTGWCEVRILNSSGEILWVKLTGQPIFDTGEGGENTVVGIQSFLENITDKKFAEEALAESEEKYRGLVERAKDGVAIVQDGIVRFANPRLAETFGFDVEEIIGSSFLDYIIPDERPRLADIHKRRMQGEDLPELYETTGLHRDESRIDLEINCCRITYRGAPATLSFIRNISDRRRSEAERMEKEKLQGVIELAGAVCHELNQPLQAISGISDLLMMNIDGSSPIYENIQVMKKRVHEMGETTRKLALLTQYKTKEYLKGKIIDIDKAFEEQEK